MYLEIVCFVLRDMFMYLIISIHMYSIIPHHISTHNMMYMMYMMYTVTLSYLTVYILYHVNHTVLQHIYTLGHIRTHQDTLGHIRTH